MSDYLDELDDAWARSIPRIEGTRAPRGPYENLAKFSISQPNSNVSNLVEVDDTGIINLLVFLLKLARERNLTIPEE